MNTSSNIVLDRAGLSQLPYRATFHEIGHLLDHFMDVGFRSVKYKNGPFENTLRTEATKYIRVVEKYKVMM